MLCCFKHNDQMRVACCHLVQHHTWLCVQSPGSQQRSQLQGIQRFLQRTWQVRTPGEGDFLPAVSFSPPSSAPRTLHVVCALLRSTATGVKMHRPNILSERVACNHLPSFRQQRYLCLCIVGSCMACRPFLQTSQHCCLSITLSNASLHFASSSVSCMGRVSVACRYQSSIKQCNPINTSDTNRPELHPHSSDRIPIPHKPFGASMHIFNMCLLVI
jgi:hypothetical protein